MTVRIEEVIDTNTEQDTFNVSNDSAADVLVTAVYDGDRNWYTAPFAIPAGGSVSLTFADNGRAVLTVYEAKQDAASGAYTTGKSLARLRVSA